ncbi:hypothetical protein [Novosphingobium sp.]|jgi:hypothetical protein|uniref:hypothetical protein n=1 Tax=Novosphingobium sp. TaxID=1874826 RepID=UPI0022C1F2A2|nr:hypothetical protein [Novosphingobium sp.]MCZ8018928.1 hypothetical protein [Novosphingobium sp.]MCZ8034534.1 hypothetical protein [Novosphingobium sp.]MCZ8052082.1 hypothetical protein [Novosphingobium sp.]MCZ8060008.1 hypothetical protein [Novosphingobium sp.]MCZ8230970.1 hypothetical protein [Novosphingobium sp.]
MSNKKLFIVSALLVLPGCGVAGAAVDLASAPVRGTTRALEAGSTVVDVMTTSQSEKDQKRGREIRRREERLGELDREYRKQSKKCERGDDEACRKADYAYAEMRSLMPGVPYERD